MTHQPGVYVPLRALFLVFAAVISMKKVTISCTVGKTKTILLQTDLEFQENLVKCVHNSWTSRNISCLPKHTSTTYEKYSVFSPCFSNAFYRITSKVSMISTRTG